MSATTLVGLYMSVTTVVGLYTSATTIVRLHTSATTVVYTRQPPRLHSVLEFVPLATCGGRTFRTFYELSSVTHVSYHISLFTHVHVRHHCTWFIHVNQHDSSLLHTSATTFVFYTRQLPRLLVTACM